MKKNYFKIFWDLAMLILLILLLEAKAIGPQFHEIAGLVIGAVFIFHLALNWKFVQNITQHFLTEQLKTSTRIIYMIDIMLFVSFLTIAVSGMLISKVLFPGLNYGNAHVLKTLHQSISYIALLLVGLHLGLNWNWVIVTTEKLISFKSNVIPVYVSRAIAVVILLFGIYSMTSVNLISNIATLSQIANANQSSGLEKRMLNPNQDGIGSSDSTQNGRPIANGEYRNGPRNGNGPGISGEARPGGNGPGYARGSMGGSNLFLKLGAYLGIVGAFAVVSYYLKVLFERKKIRPLV